MDGEVNNGMQCAEFEAVTSDALDGLLSGPVLEAFRAHRAQCPNCGPMYAAAEAGLRWLKSLEEAPPSAKFVSSVLAATSGVRQAQVASPSWISRLWESAALVFATVRQPRFAMSFGMAFFSVTMMLNLTGLKISHLRRLDLRPSSLVRMYHETEGKVVRYYENIRFVYELESRVRELKDSATPEQKTRPQDNEKQPKDKSSGGSEAPRYERYSREQDGTVIAGAAGELGPAVRRNL